MEEFSLQNTFDELKTIVVEIKSMQDRNEWAKAARRLSFLYDKLNEAHKKTAEHMRSSPAAF